MNKKVFLGGDFSHWNNGKEITECEFFGQKLTEGDVFIDNTALGRVIEYANSKPCILYHVITPHHDIGTQFDNYKRNWNICHNKCGALGCAIDVEAIYNYFPFSKNFSDLKIIFEFGKMIEEELKRRPIIYCGDLYCKTFYKEIRNNDWLLWLARYSPASKLNHVCDMWQYTNMPYDKDYFFGDVKKLHSILKDW